MKLTGPAVTACDKYNVHDLGLRAVARGPVPDNEPRTRQTLRGSFSAVFRLVLDIMCTDNPAIPVPAADRMLYAAGLRRVGFSSRSVEYAEFTGLAQEWDPVF